MHYRFFSSSFFFWETRPLSACSLAGPEQLGENSDEKIQKRDDIGSVVLFFTSETYGACSAGIKFTKAFEIVWKLLLFITLSHRNNRHQLAFSILGIHPEVIYLVVRRMERGQVFDYYLKFISFVNTIPAF